MTGHLLGHPRYWRGLYVATCACGWDIYGLRLPAVFERHQRHLHHHRRAGGQMSIQTQQYELARKTVTVIVGIDADEDLATVLCQSATAATMTALREVTVGTADTGEAVRACDACNGTGQYVDYPSVPCPKCNGCQNCSARNAKPEWRRLVDNARRNLGQGYQFRSVMGRVFGWLSDIEETAGRESGAPERQLAALIALCEQQVGDGWTAEPAPDFVGSEFHSTWALGFTFCDGGNKADAPSEGDWQALGDHAAAWLAALEGK